MDETQATTLRKQIFECEALVTELQDQLPDPALEWPITVLRRAIERNRQALRGLHPTGNDSQSLMQVALSLARARVESSGPS